MYAKIYTYIFFLRYYTLQNWYLIFIQTLTDIDKSQLGYSKSVSRQSYLKLEV